MGNEKESSAKPRASTALPQAVAQSLREWMTALISLAIAIVALWMLIDTYTTGKLVPTEGAAKAQLDAFARQKDLLLYTLALLGTVTGYYFGRVPAELHAQRAEGEAKASREQAKAAKDEQESTKRKTKQSLQVIRKKATGRRESFGATDAGAGTGSAGTVAEEIDRLIDELE